ncbi:MAG: hypothetical protein AABX16_03455 [Nanoarchaeota archaeon]
MTTTLVATIVVIISFGVILAFLYFFSFPTVIDTEACRQSIIYRASVKFGLVDSASVVPLQCQTEKICFSMSGDCILSNSKDNPVRIVKLSTEAASAKATILNTLAESMRACHYMLGEGQLDFMPRKLETVNYGLICTRFAFDEKAKQTIESISYSELYSTLEKKKLQNGKSYLEYLYPGFTNSRDSVLLFTHLQQQGKIEKNVDPKNFGIPLSEERGYIIMAIMEPKGTLKSWALGIGTAAAIPAGVGLIATGIGAPIGVLLLTSATTIGATSFVAGSYVFAYTYPNKYTYYPPSVQPFDVKKLQDQKIYSFDIAP